MRKSIFLHAALSLLLVSGLVNEAHSFEVRDVAIQDHIHALETAAMAELETVLADFESRRLAPGYLSETTAEERREVIEKIRRASATSESTLINISDGLHILTLGGNGVSTNIAFDVEATAPFRIITLSVSDDTKQVRDFGLTRENLGERFSAMVREDGFSGVVYFRDGDKLVHRAAYGVANSNTGAPVITDTVFGIGSRPIDFTIAGIFLLAEQGKLELGDSISGYFDVVPSDKQSMTIRHLLNGESGLPDFHDIPSDADPDLTWISRDEAVRRIFAQALLFEPGTDRSHSHSAFGLAAAVIEIASGMPYMDFLSEHFFDPAGMDRTGEYGDTLGLDETEFAVGGGPSFVGEPNIPPNWGKTSWLVKGSGGMVSTLDDLLKFYDYVRTSGVLTGKHVEYFNGDSLQVDGSQRGFELFSFSADAGARQFYLFTNMESGQPFFRELISSVEAMINAD